MSLIFNSLIAWLNWLAQPFTKLVFGMPYLYDWTQGSATIPITVAVPATGLTSAGDVQTGVDIYRHYSGAIIGYDSAGEIDKTDIVVHVTPEGTIIIWGPDVDPNGVWCLVWPFNTSIDHITVDGSAITISPLGTFSIDQTARWDSTDRPGHWFLNDPRVTINLKYDSTDAPYVTTTYWRDGIVRYDYKGYMPVYVKQNMSVSAFMTLRPPIVESHERDAQIDRACWAFALLAKKYNDEPSKFDNYRRKTYIL